jgi:hypothetical protein
MASVNRNTRATTSEVFYGGAPTASIDYTTGWKGWTRPKGATFVFLHVMGSGSGGGGGGVGGTGGVAAGGASGGVARVIIPAFLLPKTLYLFVPPGGLGGAPGVDGSNGGRAAVCIRPNRMGVSADTVINSGAYASASQAGTVAAGTNGAAGAGVGAIAEIVFQRIQGPFSSFGVWTAIKGDAGAAGGAVSNWGPGGKLTSSGTGGSGGLGIVPPFIPAMLASAGPAIGGHGLHSEEPWVSTCGFGSTAPGAGIAAGASGQAQYGCGGAGGGVGGTGAAGGTGGSGGPGMILIVTW